MLNFRSFAQCLLVGKLGQDAKALKTKTGASMLSFSIATNASVKKQDGGYETVTTWHDCLMFGSRSEKLATALKKGTVVCLQGSLNYREVELKNGYKGKTCSILVEDLQIVAEAANRNGNGGSGHSAPAASRQTPAGQDYADEPWASEDEIPC